MRGGEVGSGELFRRCGAAAGVVKVDDMVAMRTLAAGWSRELERLVSSVRSSLCICSPYVTEYGVDLVVANLDAAVRQSVRVTLLTDL